MKKKLFLLATVLLLVFAMTLPLIADEPAEEEEEPTVYAYYLQEYGQQQIIVGDATTKAPTIDGKVEANEYTKLVHLTPESAGVITNGITTEKPNVGYIDLYFSYDKDFIYVAGVVQEDKYVFKNDDKDNYSRLVLDFGFRMNGSSVQAMDRFNCTLGINDSAQESYFTGIGFLEYAEDGKYYPDLSKKPENEGKKKWTYMNADENGLFETKNFKRTTDANGKNITVYEFQMRKSIIRLAFGFPEDYELSNTCYFLADYTNLNDEGKKAGLVRYMFPLSAASGTPQAEKSAEAMIALLTDYGWCASFVPHTLVFGSESDLPAPPVPEEENSSDVTPASSEETPTTEAPKTTEAPVTTNAPATTEAPATTQPAADVAGHLSG